MPRRKGNARDDEGQSANYENMQTEDQWGGASLTDEEFDEFYKAIRSCRGPDETAGECPAPTDGRE